MSNITDDRDAKNEITKHLQAVFTRGLKEGSKAICGVVLKEIGLPDKSAEDKLKTLKIFCEKSLDLKTKVEE